MKKVTKKESDQISLEQVTGKVTEKSNKLIKEYKEFITRGNVVDLTVGVIIGTAFGKIVTSLVNDVLMPFLGLLIGGIDLTKLSFTIKDANIMYGKFLQSTLDFLIIAACIFLLVKVVTKLSKKEEKVEEVKEVKTEKSEEVILLTEIRDLLKKKRG